MVKSLIVKPNTNQKKILVWPENNVCTRSILQPFDKIFYFMSVEIGDAGKFYKRRFEVGNVFIIAFEVEGDIHFPVGFTQSVYADFYVVISTEVSKKINVFDIGVVESHGYVFAMVQFVNEVGHVTEKRQDNERNNGDAEGQEMEPDATEHTDAGTCPDNRRSR